MDATHIEDLPSDPEDVFEEYDAHTRMGRQPERGPFEDYLGHQIGRFANEAGQALSVPIGSPDEATVLRGFLQRFRRGCWKMAYKLNCLSSEGQGPADQEEPSGSRQRGGRSMSLTTSLATSSIGGRGGQLRAVNMSTRRTRGKEAPPRDNVSEENSSEESEETSRSDDDDPPYGHDEIGHSQLPDAPTPSQRSPAAKRQARACDRADVGSMDILPTKPGCPRCQKKPYTPHPSHC